MDIVAGHTVYLLGEINEESGRTFLREFDAVPFVKNEFIRIVLCSPGGDAEWGMAIYDMIRLSQSPTIIEGYGMVQSMAAVLLQSAKIRLLSPESRFMIHNGSVHLETEQDRLAGTLQECRRLTTVYHRILSERSGLSLKDIGKLCRNETFLSAEEAVEYGFADQVLL